jgi:hypothetical protein
MTKIILSYRRSDSAWTARTIYDRLTAHFGPGTVYMDIDSIPLAVDFRSHINEALNQADILLEIVGPQWIGRRESGGSRINDANDPVRIEVETALRVKIPLIPVLVDRANMPVSGELPDSMKDFPYLNAAQVDAGRDFHQQMARLIRSMEQILVDKPKQSASTLEGGAMSSVVAPQAGLPARAAAEQAQQRGQSSQPSDFAAAPARSFLLGLALDTSGSMQDSIHNDTNRVLSRLEGVQEAIRSMGAAAQAEYEHHADGNEQFRIFIYGFGLRHGDQVGDLISMLRAARSLDLDAEVEKRRVRYEAEAPRAASSYGALEGLARSYGLGGLVDQAIKAVRQKVEEKITGEIVELIRERAGAIGDSTVSATELVQMLKVGETGANIHELKSLIYGGTPMTAVASQILQRFKREPPGCAGNEQRALLVVSDGEPTDGDPRSLFAEIRSLGVAVVSCFVTSVDIADPRVLSSRAGEAWSAGARLMFEIASPIERERLLAQHLGSHGWRIESDAKLFVQVNHSKVLEEFIGLSAGYFSGRGPVPVGR